MLHLSDPGVEYADDPSKKSIGWKPAPITPLICRTWYQPPPSIEGDSFYPENGSSGRYRIRYRLYYKGYGMVPSLSI